jgi:hypothetical protein
MALNHRNLLLFYVLIYGTFYIADEYYLHYVGPTSAGVAPRVLSALSSLVIASAVVYLLNRRKEAQGVLRTLGLKKEGILSSFVWANAFLLPILIFLSGMLLVSGPESLLANSSVPLPTPTPPWYPLFASTAWITSGVVAFPILQAYPYESLIDFPKRYVIPLIVVLWAGLYNASLLTGEFKPDDIIFFGFLFTVAYHKSRNSIGLVAAYVLAEAPLWYVVAETWGVPIFSWAIPVRTLIAAVCVGVLIFQHHGSRFHPAYSEQGQDSPLAQQIAKPRRQRVGCTQST